MNENRPPHKAGFGFALNGGPEGDRTLDLTDANKPLKLFSIISGRFWPFPLRFASSFGLFDHDVSVWSGAVCGRFCGQKRSPALAGVFRRQGRGAFFRPLYCLDCNSKDRIKQVISVPSTAQKLRDCKQNKRGSIKIHPLAYPGAPGFDPADHKPLR